MSTPDKMVSASAIEAAREKVEQLRWELNDIQTNPNNPLHAGFWRNDPHVSRLINEKYREVYGDGKIDIS
jgi:hypothetical protein